MPNYDILYPNAKHLQFYGNLLYTQEECKCAICQEPTKWIDNIFYLNLCSTECYRIFWRKYLSYIWKHGLPSTPLESDEEIISGYFPEGPYK
jgi:endogenous inhibitor of DNA gyrase (YacG/DUF329 family)